MRSLIALSAILLCACAGTPPAGTSSTPVIESEEPVMGSNIRKRAPSKASGSEASSNRSSSSTER